MPDAGSLHCFNLTGFKTAWGERVILSGSINELGQWDPANALQLECRDEGTRWEAHLRLPSEITHFEYKYAVIRNSTEAKGVARVPNGSRTGAQTPTPSLLPSTGYKRPNGNGVSSSRKNSDSDAVKGINKSHGHLQILWEAGDNRKVLMGSVTSTTLVHGNRWRGPGTEWPRKSVHLAVTGCLTDDKDEVRVVGGIPEFGDWNPDFGVPLHKTGPLSWAATFQFRDELSDVEYKFVIVKEMHYEWEGGENRIIDCDNTDAAAKSSWKSSGSYRTQKKLTEFSVVNCPADLGDKVLVVGSIPELGSWNPRKGLLLDYDSTGNIWAKESWFPKSNISFEYKYAVWRKLLDIEMDLTDKIEWEGGMNRVESSGPPESDFVAFEDSWRCHEQDRGKPEHQRRKRAVPRPCVCPTCGQPMPKN